MQTAPEALSALLEERAASLSRLAARLQTYQTTDALPPHRVLALSGTLLALLADVEREAHQLARYLPDVREL
jgi:hypothetical protein